MKKISTAELLAILAAVGVSTTSAIATESNSKNDQDSLGKAEQSRPVFLAKKDSACGKGSCGKDEKGAAAAKSKHSSKDAKSSAKTESKSDAKAKDDAKSEEKKSDKK